MKLSSDHTDRNGHVSEVGYLTVANFAYWQICDQVGLSKLYNRYNISGIVFDTHMEFKKEVFEGEKVIINLTFTIKNDIRKDCKAINYPRQQQSAGSEDHIEWWILDLEKRKIVEPPKPILDVCHKYLSD